jgi:trimeric autotransporter adhesin
MRRSDESDGTISTVDADGVALAAIQGLHQVVQEKDARIAALESRLVQLQRIVESLATKQ